MYIHTRTYIKTNYHLKKWYFVTRYVFAHILVHLILCLLCIFSVYFECVYIFAYLWNVCSQLHCSSNVAKIARTFLSMHICTYVCMHLYKSSLKSPRSSYTHIRVYAISRRSNLLTISSPYL